MDLRKFCLASGLLLGSLTLTAGCKPAENKPGESGTPSTTATEGAPAATTAEPTTEPLGSG